MTTTKVNQLTDLGTMLTNDVVVGERVSGTTVTFNYVPKIIGGTIGYITVTNGNSDSPATITIDATYAGQSSITTVGTLATGIWRAIPVEMAYGGTNANLTASNGGIFYSTATSGAILSGTATANKILLSSVSSAPVWSTPTFPNASATAGKLIRSDGTNWAASTSTFADTYGVSTILYASSANTVAGLATANSGVLVTSGAGVPSIATDISTAVTIGGAAVYRSGG